jgi:hypothetical protein
MLMKYYINTTESIFKNFILNILFTNFLQALEVLIYPNHIPYP